MYKSYINELQTKITPSRLFDGKKPFLFSFVIPIYNVEDYLEETLESIINQTLDFASHVQIVLVNDGSPDNSERICLEYQEKFPANITYVLKENGGVSSARNLGAEYATGEIVNFLDSDDILDATALEKVYTFFKKHGNQIDAVALPIQYFEAKTGPHMLSYKFYKTRVIDIFSSPSDIQMHVSSVFFKRDAIKNIHFDANLKYGEDAKYFTEVMIKTGKYGVISDAPYYYRVRHSQNSAIQTSKFSESWYTNSLINFSLSIIQSSLIRFGEVPSYIQYLVMYDLQWKLKMTKIPSEVLNDAIKKEFLVKAVEVLQFIDDDVIFKQKHIDYQLKMAIQKLKYSDDSSMHINYVRTQDNVFLYYGNRLLDKLDSPTAYIDVVEVNNGQFILEGFVASAFDKDDINVVCSLNNRLLTTTKLSRPKKDRFLWDLTIKQVHGFRIEISCDEVNELSKLGFRLQFDNVTAPVKYTLLNKVPFSKKIPSYYAKDELVIYPLKKVIVLAPTSLILRIKKELGMLKRLFKLGKRKKSAWKAATVRLFYRVSKFALGNKPIYLFMDRNDQGGDNAEALFKYALSQNDDIRKYFIIDKSSSDFEKINAIGKTVDFGSYHHKILLLLANKFISSHADEALLNPFGSMKEYYKDLITYDFVFLQHGVTQNDLSDWLNKYGKNIKLLVTSSKYEYTSILEGDYSYSKKEVKLTGMPRHDLLQSNSYAKKVILVMPTWRKNLASPLNSDYERPYNEEFKQSDYFKLYSAFLSDPTLLDELRDKNFEIQFVLHPSLKKQAVDFSIFENDVVKVLNPENINYRELFNDSTLLITDYSSVAFDFAYLRKPIIYFQFDLNEFNLTHFTRGYFDYETLGFGPVTETLSQLIHETRKHVSNSYAEKTFYLERVNNFFEFSDSNNCKRVYDEIKKL